MKKQKGFTLIEMLVVIVIIGILATLVIINVSSGRKKAIAVKANAQVSQLSTALETAATEGCRKISFSSGADGILTCADTGKEYARIPANSVPSGLKYTINIGGNNNVCDATAGNCTGWTTAITSVSVNNGYSFQISGYPSSTTFQCNDGLLSGASRTGCFCSEEGGCLQPGN